MMVFHEVIEELPACVHSGGENAVDDLFSACIALRCYELLKGPRDGSHCKLLCVSLNVVFLSVLYPFFVPAECHANLVCFCFAHR